MYKQNEYSNLTNNKINGKNKNKIGGKFQTVVYIFLFAIILYLFLKYNKLKYYSKELENQLININENISNNNVKIIEKYIKDISLQLYIENRTEYYIKGRQEIMKNVGSNYNDSNVKTFQDKLNWLLVHESPEQKYNIVDKILLRKYSEKILGKNICVPIIKIYKEAEEININDLPDKFVLKCNHGSGMNIICENKTQFNITDAKLKLNEWMKINYGLFSNEYQYIHVKRKIFAEIFLMNNLIEYKFYCFNGSPKLIKAQTPYYTGNFKVYHYYDLNWTITDIETKLPGNVKLSTVKFQRPKHLKLMIEYAKKLSQNYAFVRVDLYEFNDTVYLSELTFTPANAISPYRDQKQRMYLGNLLDISKVKK